MSGLKPIPWGLLTPSDTDLLYRVSSGKENVVELGTFLGKSAAIMAHGAKHVTTIDTFEGLPVGGNDSTMNQFYSYEKVSAFFKEHYSNVTVRKGNSCALANEFFNVDLLFIDADHNYPHVKNDFLYWYPKVVVNGIIMFHDYDSYTDNGVRIFVNELFKNLARYGLEFFHYTTPTIMFKKVINVSKD